MQTKITIGLTFTGTDEKHNNYVNWLNENAGIEIITLSAGHDNLDAVQGVDGIVLSGGIDMHPKYYRNEIINYPNAPLNFNEERDAFEIAVFELSQQYRLPVLAICRGMQLVNCVLGGTLTQDLDEANTIHRFLYNDKAHGVDIVPGTLLSEVTQAYRAVANSAHHQCINILGKGLKINCTSDDGVIEGIEWENKSGQPLFLGIQWHPERMYKFHLQDSLLSKNLRDWFINELKILKNNS